MPNRSTSFLIHCLDHQISQRNSQRLNQIGLTLPQAVVLDFLFWRQQETVNQRSLEKFMQLSNPSVTSLLRNMESKGLVVRERDESDGRSRNLKLTDKGIAMHPVAGGIFEETNEKLAEVLGPADREIFRGLLLKLEKSLIEEERGR
ncbi:MarR family winged helix-turn-helix transcriptional regulator [Gehongia tenuis]|uniref:MarR family transcriptional regulator n=1 Tax=Gehongia tenuis TaxID=2763655 RepID=A0A926HP99_9FIRM|nr:MarR family transcriptional regulator [Gehongia tenuis]MBC8530465.1 MarR family transcriptional regulator [Gehongia tenuis]